MMSTNAVCLLKDATNAPCTCIPMEGSNLLGFFQLSVMVLPVMDSITGVPSGGSGRMSVEGKICIFSSKKIKQINPIHSVQLDIVYS